MATLSFALEGRATLIVLPAASTPFYQSSETCLLPFFALADCFSSMSAFFMAITDAQQRISVVGKLAAHKNAVAGLDVRQLDGRRVFQAFAQAQFERASWRPGLEGHVAPASVSKSWYAGNRPKPSHRPRHGRSLRGWLRPAWACAAWEWRNFPAATQANRCNQKAAYAQGLFQNASDASTPLFAPSNEGRFVGPTRKPTKLLKIQVSHKTYSGVNIVSPARTFPAAMTPLTHGREPTYEPWHGETRESRKYSLLILGVLTKNAADD